MAISGCGEHAHEDSRPWWVAPLVLPRALSAAQCAPVDACVQREASRFFFDPADGASIERAVRRCWRDRHVETSAGGCLPIRIFEAGPPREVAMPSDGNIPSGLQVRFSWLPVEQCHCLGRVEAGDCVAATQTQFERSVRLLIVGDPTGRSIVEPRAVPLPPAWLKRAVALFGLDAVLGVEDTWIVDWTTLREVATLFGERPPRAIMTPSQTIVFKTSEHPQRLWALVEELRSERCSRHDAHPSYTLLTGSPDWTTDAINVECETTARELRKQLETLVPPSTWPEEPPLEEGLCGGAYAHARAFALSHEDVRFVYLDPLFTAMLRFFLQRAWTPEAVEVLGTLPATWGRRSRFDTAP